MSDIHIMNTKNLRRMTPEDIYNLRGKTHRELRTAVTLPSQYSSYAVCLEFIKEWFLSKFPHRFFNSIYVEGSHSFDEFRKFSDINAQLKRANPLLAIIPTIDMAHNRDWIDSNPEFPFSLRRTKMEGTFFNDIRDNRGLHLQIQFKTISMRVVFKIRLDTKAETLDMMEYIKLVMRAGWSETQNLALDVNVPRNIIQQIAWDNDILMNEDGTIVDNTKMLEYLNQYSLIPFLYKLRCATGNNEYFIKVPNCVAHIKSELPEMDDGDRQDQLTTNYNIDFPLEVQMSAPYCYIYYSQKDRKFILNGPKVDQDEVVVCVSKHVMTEIPPIDEHNWKMITEEAIRYEIDEEDIGKEIDIDFKPEFENTDIGALIQWNIDTHLAPELFINFKIFNDGKELKYDMDWNTLIMHIKDKISNLTILIAVYTDQKYVNETLLYLRDSQNNPSRIHY